MTYFEIFLGFLFCSGIITLICLLTYRFKNKDTKDPNDSKRSLRIILYVLIYLLWVVGSSFGIWLDIILKMEILSYFIFAGAAWGAVGLCTLIYRRF